MPSCGPRPPAWVCTISHAVRANTLSGLMYLIPLCSMRLTPVDRPRQALSTSSPCRTPLRDRFAQSVDGRRTRRRFPRGPVDRARSAATSPMWRISAIKGVTDEYPAWRVLNRADRGDTYPTVGAKRSRNVSETLLSVRSKDASLPTPGDVPMDDTELYRERILRHAGPVITGRF